MAMVPRHCKIQKEGQQSRDAKRRKADAVPKNFALMNAYIDGLMGKFSMTEGSLKSPTTGEEVVAVDTQKGTFLVIRVDDNTFKIIKNKQTEATHGPGRY
nr:MetaGeneMark_Unknown Function [uncultured bacterium]